MNRMFLLTTGFKASVQLTSKYKSLSEPYKIWISVFATNSINLIHSTLQTDDLTGMTLDFKDIGIRKCEFAAKTQFLSWILLFTNFFAFFF